MEMEETNHRDQSPNWFVLSTLIAATFLAGVINYLAPQFCENSRYGYFLGGLLVAEFLLPIAWNAMGTQSLWVRCTLSLTAVFVLSTSWLFGLVKAAEFAAAIELLVLAFVIAGAGWAGLSLFLAIANRRGLRLKHRHQQLHVQRKPLPLIAFIVLISVSAIAIFLVQRILQFADGSIGAPPGGWGQFACFCLQNMLICGLIFFFALRTIVEPVTSLIGFTVCATLGIVSVLASFAIHMTLVATVYSFPVFGERYFLLQSCLFVGGVTLGSVVASLFARLIGLQLVAASSTENQPNASQTMPTSANNQMFL